MKTVKEKTLWVIVLAVLALSVMPAFGQGSGQGQQNPPNPPPTQPAPPRRPRGAPGGHAGDA